MLPSIPSMSVTLEPGTIFASDFRVVRPLDAGGMGSLYVVDQLSTGNQRALKLMHPQLVADPKLRERFLQEARVGSTINSDHIVQVIAAGVDNQRNLPWLVMELLQGEELGVRVRRAGALQRTEIAEIMKQLGHALMAAHAVGVVHRDLKPNNIFLSRPRVAGAQFLVKVLDFGIAKVVAEAQTTGTTGMGTPLWMAPEQTESRSRVGPPTDIWALGLLAFWMLTGEIYWVSASDASTSVHAVLREMLMEPIVAPSVRARDRGRAELVPQGFDAWFLRCLERNIDARYQSVESALTELQSILAGRAAADGTLASSPLSVGMQNPAQAGAYAPPPPTGGQPHAAPPPCAMAGGYGTAPGNPNWAPPPAVAQTAGGYAQPGYGAPPPPAQPPYGSGPYGYGAAAPLPAKSNTLLFVLLGVGALFVLGIVGTIALSGVSRYEERARHARSDDDDDEPTFKTKKKKSGEEKVEVDEDKPVELSKAEQCQKLLGVLQKAKDDVDHISTSMQPGPPQLRAMATTMDGVAVDSQALPLTDPLLKNDAVDYAVMSRDCAKAARTLADALDIPNLPLARQRQKDLETVTAREGPILTSVNTYCGVATP